MRRAPSHIYPALLLATTSCEDDFKVLNLMEAADVVKAISIISSDSELSIQCNKEEAFLLLDGVKFLSKEATRTNQLSNSKSSIVAENSMLDLQKNVTSLYFNLAQRGVLRGFNCVKPGLEPISIRPVKLLLHGYYSRLMKATSQIRGYRLLTSQ